MTLPLTKGKIIVFRCDALGLNYSYRPKGTAGTAGTADREVANFTLRFDKLDLNHVFGWLGFNLVSVGSCWLGFLTGR